ncbi:hypothetical protein GCM10010176_066470 [Nonomuraea spiralis]|nr:hypothetical protein GCM10010176_066470 [Nonomuraea spiralis]
MSRRLPFAARLVITTGKKKGHHPSAATVLRMLARPGRDHPNGQDGHEDPVPLALAENSVDPPGPSLRAWAVMSRA